MSPLCMFGESVFGLIPDTEVRAAKLTNRWISGCWWGRDASSDEHLVETKHGLLECRSVRREPPGKQWSRRGTVEARGTKWNFGVEMDSGISGTHVASRPDEGMPTATAQEEIPTVPPPAPPPDSHVPKRRNQVYTRKHSGSDPSDKKSAELLDARHVRRRPVQGSHTLVTASRIKMPGTRAAEQHQRRRRNVELLEFQRHDRWTRAEVRRFPSRRGQKQPLRQTTKNPADQMDEDNFRRGPATSHQLEPVDDDNVSKKARVARNVLHIPGGDSVQFDVNEEACQNADLVIRACCEGALIDGLPVDKVKVGDEREIQQMKDLQLYSWVKETDIFPHKSILLTGWAR